MSYQNLKAEMKRSNTTQGQIAEFLGMSRNNFSLKVNERVPFTLDEIKAIRDEFFPENSIDYLAKSDGDRASADARATARVECIADAIERRGRRDGDPEAFRVADELRETAGKVDAPYVLEVLGDA